MVPLFGTPSDCGGCAGFDGCPSLGYEQVLPWENVVAAVSGGGGGVFVGVVVVAPHPDSMSAAIIARAIAL